MNGATTTVENETAMRVSGNVGPADPSTRSACKPRALDVSDLEIRCAMAVVAGGGETLTRRLRTDMVTASVVRNDVYNLYEDQGKVGTGV